MSNTFVLKTYTTPSAPKDYETEKKAYQKLAERDVDKRYIVNFYGNFTHGGTHNIIMERADEGSLEDYFQKHTPPSESEHIRQFWENLFHILIALQSIHHVEQTSNGLPRVLKGFVTHTRCLIRRLH
jgi:serine/threonine protein kinase